MTTIGVTTIGGSTMEDIAALRGRVDVECKAASTVEIAAQRFIGLLVERFPTIALARLFIVLPFEALPQNDRNFAARLAQRMGGGHPIDRRTPVLSLLGTRGVEASWNSRTRSAGHLAIPLLDREFALHAAPMIAQLLSHLEGEFARFDDGRPILPRMLLGGKNLRFFVPDAAKTRDQHGRPVIVSQEFVAQHRIKTVFGMGGGFYDGTLAATVLFSQESLDVTIVDRFPSLISNFKMAASHLVTAGRIYGAAR